MPYAEFIKSVIVKWSATPRAPMSSGIMSGLFLEVAIGERFSFLTEAHQCGKTQTLGFKIPFFVIYFTQGEIYQGVSR